MAGLPIFFAVPSESQIATYNWTDIADGSGVVTFYPFLLADKTGFMGDKVLSSTTTDGIISTDNMLYSFFSNTFNSPRVVNGACFVSCYVKGSATITAELYLLRGGEIVTSGVGEVIVSSATEVETGDDYPVLMKTIVVGNYVNKVDGVLKRNVQATSSGLRTRFYYENDDYFQSNSTATTSWTEWIPYSHANPNPGKFVTRIEIWGSGATPTVSTKDHDVYGEVYNSSDLIELGTASGSVSAEGAVSLKFDIDKTKINKGDRLIFKIKSSGGNIVLDPTGLFETKPSVQLNVPFDIDL